MKPITGHVLVTLVCTSQWKWRLQKIWKCY